MDPKWRDELLVDYLPTKSAQDKRCFFYKKKPQL
jgi:hypothetical protein